MKDKTYYIGYTENLEKRVDQHNNGESNYTKSKLPWQLVYSEEYKLKTDALRREHFLKAQKNTSFYQKLIGSLDR